MDVGLLKQAISLLRRCNASLEPKRMEASFPRECLALYGEVEKLGAYGTAALSRKVDDVERVARATGTSIGKARAAVETGRALRDAPQVEQAFRKGRVSLDQAAEIAGAEQVAPDSASELLQVAEKESFQVLRQKARSTALEACRGDELALRQRRARRAVSHDDEMGMVHIHLTFEPHVGAPVVARAETEAARLQREAARTGEAEPFERHLADAYAALLSGEAEARGRGEVVVVVSHEVAKRGWKDVKNNELCKIPGLGPVSPQAAKEIAADAFLSGLFYDGKDLRHLKRWTRKTPPEVLLALRLGEPPSFDGFSCRRCGRRHRIEKDHVKPHAERGPASLSNLMPLCSRCHREKTRREQRARARSPG